MAGMGMSLASYGQGQQQEAMSQLADVSRDETQRNIRNEQNQAAAKAGNQQLGSTLGSLGGMAFAGAKYGAAAGPYGAIIGGIVGALAGNFFD